MSFWDFWNTEEQVKIKNLTLTYYEINQILTKLDSEYRKQGSSKEEAERNAGRHGVFIISRAQKTFKKFFKRKYKYK